MRNIRALAAAMLFICLGAAPGVTGVRAGGEVWVLQPDRTSIAVLAGDPSASGYYAMRVKLPPNWSEAPHYHLEAENVTLISGTAYLGLGRTFDRTKAVKYAAGAFVSIPAKAAHYAFTDSAGAVIQVDGIGPFRQLPIK
jgi:quercetin dioxygenase-like cupin family protein